jgi:ppGpp synthetase/RelA/SpoT-type nucleotidyltranferase
MNDQASSKEYETITRKYSSLIDEFLFILSGIEETTSIKIHTIESRIKKFASAKNKLREKRYSKYEEIGDIAGIRIVCLFISDVSKVKDYIISNFDVVSSDEKNKTTDTPFSYLSDHYICTLPRGYAGPRYEPLQGLNIEIQVRTICQHCWAALSHHLDYKTETPLAPDAKRELLAMAGLFYVADQQFERFFLNQRQIASSRNDKEENITTDIIRLKDFGMLIRERFKNRNHAPQNAITELHREAMQAGYRSLDQILRDIDRGEEAMKKYESEKRAQKSLSRAFADVGAARVSMRIVSDTMRKQSNMADVYLPFRKYVTKP